MLLDLKFRFVTDDDYWIDGAEKIIQRTASGFPPGTVDCGYEQSPEGDETALSLTAHGEPDICRRAATEFMNRVACSVRSCHPDLIPDLFRLTTRPRELLEETARDFRYWDALSDRGNYAGTEVVLNVTYEEDRPGTEGNTA